MAIKLHCVKGDEAGQVLVIPDEGNLVIGRSQTADISLDDKMLSRKHARILCRNRTAILEDLQSSNGTYLNGERVRAEVRLAGGDRIKLGRHLFQVELTKEMVGFTGTSSDGTFGSMPLPTEARPVVFCALCYRATTTDVATERPEYGHVCPDCTEADNYPDTMIEGFKLLERLGEGRCGVVFKAQHLALMKYVAIKVIRSERAVNQLVLRRYIREAKIGGRLFHPHVIEMYDAAVSGGHYYISMEFIQGETLMRRVGMYGCLPVAEIINYGAKIADALAYAHDQGVVHRDVTPACIFLGAGGRVKLGDFGLASLKEGEEQLTPEGEALGSLCYMPPEQLESATNVDCRADIHNLGASMYHGLVGYPPFAASDVHAVLENRKNGALVPLLQARPDCPSDFAALITHCLAHDRGHRYQTAAELRDAILAVQDGLAGPSQQPASESPSAETPST